MKTLIPSDLHSNIDALESIWKREQDSDLIICAGDLVDIGPRPKEVIDWVQTHNAICVKGNHDSYLVDYHDSDGSDNSTWEKQECWLQHNLDQLQTSDIEFLRALPESKELEIDSVSFGVTHAYKGYDVIIGAFAFESFLTERFTSPDIQTLIFGHTHRQAICHVSKTQSWINPGSVSYRSYLEPGNTNTGAEYMTLTDGHFAFERIAYDTSHMHREISALDHELSRKTIEMALDRFPAVT